MIGNMNVIPHKEMPAVSKETKDEEEEGKMFLNAIYAFY
jgi:hypothetical protein